MSVQVARVTVGQDFPGFGRVGQLNGQDMAELGLESGIEYGKGDLDPVVEVARHPVGRGQKVLGFAGVLKIKDAGVFQKAVDNGNHADIIRNARQSGPQAANAPNDQVDLHPGLAGRVEFFDEGLVNQTVELGNEAGGTAGSGVFDFAPNAADHAVSELGRGDQEVMKVL